MIPESGLNPQDLKAHGRAALAYKTLHGETPEEEETLLWLLTFTDIMALLLTFFVMMYSMSSPKEEEWKEVSTGISSESRKYRSDEWYEGEQAALSLERVDFSKALNLDYLESVMKQAISKDKRLEDVVLLPRNAALVVSLPQELLFESGRAEVSTAGRQAVLALGASLGRIRNRIEVMGHADPRPVEGNKGAFQDNWTLSLARASSVALILGGAGYEREITVRGLSSGRYQDLPQSLTETERQALSRRVDIVIMPDDGHRATLLNP